MQIRRATAADAERLSAIAQQAKAWWGYAPAQLALWRAELSIDPASAEQLQTAVALLDGVIAGFYQLEHEGGDARLTHLWVDPLHMRQRIGQNLLTHACQHASAAGALSLLIDADPHSLNFYIACGARQTGALPAPIEGDPDRSRPQLMLSLSVQANC